MFEQLAFLDVGAPELLLILLIALLLFGGRKLPELAKSLGTSARELRKGLDGGDEKVQKQTSDKTESKTTS